MARYHGPDVPLDKRYSEKEVKKIHETINSIILSNPTDIALSCLDDIYSKNLLEFVTVLQDPQYQKIIKYVLKHRTIPSPFVQPKSKTFNMEENRKMLSESKKKLERIQYLIQTKVMDTTGVVNEKLDLDYINSIDLEKLDGYVKQQQIEFANKVDEFKKENQLTPEQLNRRFSTEI
ncbi:MAG: hypothetical protein KJ697_03930 [Nanoarchaeota archaeon]|nr:hypothetical protein [Nanoarchaeota archaeon]MBU4124545.1 hypothetical protein [Nanoarchaeota archaeon]